MKAIKTKLSVGSLARAALVAGVALSAHVASATLVTAPNPGDLFIGFRQTGVTSDVVIDLGSAANFTPSSLGSGYGGTWNGSSFTVLNATNLSTDLAQVFGSSWANNPTDGSGVTWAVVGLTSTTVNYSPFTSLKKNSIYVTQAETTPGTQSAALSLSSTLTAAPKINTLVNGSGGYKDGTILSSPYSGSAVTAVQATSVANSWSSQFGSQNAALGTNLDFEQAPNGSFSGPTNSVLDLYLQPGTGSVGGTAPSYLGSFSLSSGGVLTYGAVPEPSTYALLALSGTIFMVFIRRRNRFNISPN